MPSAIETSQFGNWLSGFVDGEGCFGIYCYKATDASFGCLGFEFSIQLREDDMPILEQIKTFLHCGQVGFSSRKKARSRGCNAMDQAKYTCRRLDDLCTKIVPQFEQYPLKAKKKKDFEIWKEALWLQQKSVILRKNKNKRILDYPECIVLREKIFSLAKQLRSGRNSRLQRSCNSLIAV